MAGRLSPLAATERRWPLYASPPLGDENLQHQRSAKVMLQTFVATACGSRCSSARAVAQRLSDNAPSASQPWPFVMPRTPAKKRGGGKGKAGPVANQPVRPRTPPGVGTPLRADGRPDQRHPRLEPITQPVRGSEEKRPPETVAFLFATKEAVSDISPHLG